MFERPEGIKIASWFIATIVATSLISRALRSTELRVQAVEPDAVAQRFIREAGDAPVRHPREPSGRQPAEEYDASCATPRNRITCRPTSRVLFLEVRPGDVSEFTRRVGGTGRRRGRPSRAARASARRSRTQSRRCCCYIRDQTGRSRTRTLGGRKATRSPTCLKFLAFGEGDTAPVTREVLRQAEPNPLRRPRIHVG